MKKQLLISLGIFCLLIIATVGVILYGKGYRFGLTDGEPRLSKTGLLVTTSNPDGAQVFIDGHLTTATNNTINLTPGEYTVKIYKDGYFPWEKKLQIQQEVVTKADATLFPIAPKLDSIATISVDAPVLDPSGSKIAFKIASQSARKNGIYILDMNAASVPIFALQSSSTQIADDTIDNFSHAALSWSPDGKQLMATISSSLKTIGTTYLLKADGFNDNPSDITAVLTNTQDAWNKQKDEKEKALRTGLKPALEKLIADDFTILSWSPDETRILYVASQSAQLPLIRTPRLPGINTLTEQRTITKNTVYVYDISEDTNMKILDALPADCLENLDTCHMPITWFTDSKHLIYVNDKKISLMDYDGTNSTTVYAGPFVDDYVFPWPNGSKLVILTNLNNPVAPTTFYTIGLK